MIFRPIDARRSDWKCTIEDGAVRLGLRFVLGLRAAAAERLVAGRPLASITDAAQRAELRKDEVEALAPTARGPGGFGSTGAGGRNRDA